MWLEDVVPYTTIQSSWGNNVRNRIVQTFADATELAAHGASLPDGAMVYIAATDTVLMRRAASPSGWRTMAMPWTAYTPTVRVGSVLMTAFVTIDRRHFRRRYGADVQVSLTFTITWPVGGSPGALSVSLPVQAAAGVPALTAIGSGRIQGGGLAGGGVFAQVAMSDPSTAAFVLPGGAYYVVSDSLSAWLTLTYEAVDG